MGGSSGLGLSSSLFSSSLSTKSSAPSHVTSHVTKPFGQSTSLGSTSMATNSSLLFQTSSLTAVKQKTNVKLEQKTTKITRKKIAFVEETHYKDDIARPHYDLPCAANDKGIEVLAFLPPEKDASLQQVSRPLYDVQAVKVC